GKPGGEPFGQPMIIGAGGEEVEDRGELQSGVVQNRPVQLLDTESDPLAQSEPVRRGSLAAARDADATISTQRPEHDGQTPPDALQFHRSPGVARVTGDATDEPVPLKSDAFLGLEQSDLLLPERDLRDAYERLLDVRLVRQRLDDRAPDGTVQVDAVGDQTRAIDEQAGRQAFLQILPL